MGWLYNNLFRSPAYPAHRLAYAGSSIPQHRSRRLMLLGCYRIAAALLLSYLRCAALWRGIQLPAVVLLSLIFFFKKSLILTLTLAKQVSLRCWRAKYAIGPKTLPHAAQQPPAQVEHGVIKWLINPWRVWHICKYYYMSL